MHCFILSNNKKTFLGIYQSLKVPLVASDINFKKTKYFEETLELFHLSTNAHFKHPTANSDRFDAASGSNEAD